MAVDRIRGTDTDSNAQSFVITPLTIRSARKTCQCSASWDDMNAGCSNRNEFMCTIQSTKPRPSKMVSALANDLKCDGEKLYFRDYQGRSCSHETSFADSISLQDALY